MIEESSETVRRAPHQTPMTEMRQSELHGDMQSGYSEPHPPLRGAQQMNGPKVEIAALVKPNHMREHPRTADWYSPRDRAAVKIQRTWGQSAGKVRYEDRKPSET